MFEICTKKRCFVACGILSVVVVVVVGSSMAFALYTGHKYRPNTADFDLIDASLKMIPSDKNYTKTNNDCKYNLTVSLTASNPNKDTYHILLRKAVGSAFYGNKIMARTSISTSLASTVGPGDGVTLKAVFVGTTPDMKNDSTRHGMNFRAYDFMVNILVEEFVMVGIKNKVANQGFFNVTCDFEVGMSYPNLTSPFHQNSKCIYNQVH